MAIKATIGDMNEGVAGSDDEAGGQPPAGACQGAGADEVVAASHRN